MKIGRKPSKNRRNKVWRQLRHELVTTRGALRASRHREELALGGAKSQAAQSGAERAKLISELGSSANTLDRAMARIAQLEKVPKIVRWLFGAERKRVTV